MKFLYKIIAVGVALPFIGSAQVDSSNFTSIIRQIQRDTGLWSLISDIPSKGDIISPLGIGSDGSVFQMWSIDVRDSSFHLLDEKTVTSYHPEAEIRIETEDPYRGVPRTRIDKGFKVISSVSGLLSPGEGVPFAATQVQLQHEKILYKDTVSFSRTGPVSKESSLSIISTNLIDNVDNRLSTIKGDIRAKIGGEEVFTIFSQSEQGLTDTSQLDSALVQIWPIADGIIGNIDVTKIYTEVPDINIVYNDLYPDSVTELVAYKGSPSDNVEDYLLLSSSIVNNVIPQSRNFVLTKADSYIEEVGIYTLEIWHTTPFGKERLDRVYPFNFDREIHINGSIISAE